MLKICVDIGGTKTIVGLINQDLEVVTSQKFTTYSDNPEKEFAEIVRVAHEYVQRYDDVATTTLNIAMPGPCDYSKGLFINPPNLQKYNAFHAGDYIAEHSNFQPCFVNDTNAAILAEYRHFHTSVEDLIYLTISTGVGMAYVRNGKLVAGSEGNFGEIGHTILKSDSAYQCPVCNQYGCVENEISGVAISRKASEILQKPVSTQEAIAMYNNDSDTTITEMIEEVLALTQRLCTNLFSIFNCHNIVLGGGVTQSTLPYKARIEAYAATHQLIQTQPFKVKISDLEANVLTGLYDIDTQ